ncbi:MAG: 4'-phosphopantetheinyl transferase superfamily protein [Aggregatilineales bacterium]
MPIIQLNQGEIHLWSAWFSAHDATPYRALLSEDEIRRADRFIVDKVREHFIIGRGILRTLIGRYVGIAPETLKFNFSERGKPAINHPIICFNLSHSADLLMLAIINDAEIGVDVEHIRPMREMRSVAHDNFSAQEFSTWERLPEAKKQSAFYTIWTRKEAYIKATGDGFRLPLKSFTVSHDSPPRFLHMDDDDINRWSLYEPETATDYAGAICTTQVDAILMHFHYEPPS